jgi:hypothetical protein
MIFPASCFFGTALPADVVGFAVDPLLGVELRGSVFVFELRTEVSGGGTGTGFFEVLWP